MLLDKVYDRVDSVIKVLRESYMISLTHPLLRPKLKLKAVPNPNTSHTICNHIGQVPLSVQEVSHVIK